MALILAIESDRRQINHLTAMVRGKLRAELVLGDTAEAALERLGDRVPDLILTSPLLSPRDEQALSDRLRRLNGVASHVPTLTLPLFAPPTGASAPARGGMLSVLLGDRGSESSPNGCDPAVFAEQCRVYLKRSVAERAANEDTEAALAPEVTAQPEVHEAPEISGEPEASSVLEAFAMPEAANVPEVPRTPETPPVFEEPDAPRAPRVLAAHLLADDPSSILAAVAAVEPEDVRELAQEPEAVSEPELPESDFADVDLSEMLEAEAETVEAETIEDEQPAVYDLSATAEPSEPVEEDFEEWERVVESLKRAGKGVQLPREKEQEPQAPVARAKTAQEPQAPVARAKTAQDEFGMYDPKLAGMAALFAKLEEFSDDDDDDPPVRRPR